MYHIYPEQMIFTKLFTPRRFDKYLQLRRLRLWQLECDYGDLDKCLNCPSIGGLCNCQGGRGGRCEGGGGPKYVIQYLCSFVLVLGQTLNKAPIHAIVNYD